MFILKVNTMNKFKIKRKVVIEEDVSYQKFMAWRIIQIRKEQGLTQQEFADKIGLSRVSVVNIEKGKQALSIKNLYFICTHLKIKSSHILPF
jgi:DNA-binding XRE family transcriptional regulator